MDNFIDPEAHAIENPPALFLQRRPGTRARKSKSNTWGTERLSSLLDCICKREMGIHMSVKIYRQCADAMQKELVEKPQRDRRILALQSAHSTAIADQYYGVDEEEFSNCPSHRTWEFLHASVSWHRLLELDGISETEDTTPILPPPPPSQHNPLMITQTNIHPINLGQDIPFQDAITNAFIRSALRILHPATPNSPPAHFKSPQQAIAVSRVLARDSPLLVILPTGGGKTDVWLIPLLDPSS